MKYLCIYKNFLTLITIKTIMDQLSANRPLLNLSFLQLIHCAVSSLLSLCKDDLAYNFRPMIEVIKNMGQFLSMCVLQRNREIVFLIHKACFWRAPLQIA